MILQRNLEEGHHYSHSKSTTMVTHDDYRPTILYVLCINQHFLILKSWLQCTAGYSAIIDPMNLRPSKINPSYVWKIPIISNKFLPDEISWHLATQTARFL
jgi:hypothetical protein